jgi:hypothetical protein
MLCAERVGSRNRALFVNCSDGADLFQVLPIRLTASFAPPGPIALAFTEEFLPTEYPGFTDLRIPPHGLVGAQISARSTSRAA